MDLVVRHSLPGLASLEVVGVIDDIDAREVYEAAPGFGKARTVVALPGDLVIVVRLRPECRPGPVHYLPERYATPPCPVPFDTRTSAWTGILSRVTCVECRRSQKFFNDSSSSSGIGLRLGLRDRRVDSSGPPVGQDLADHEALVSGEQDLIRREEE
jgi:hypothetical protein